MLTYSGDGATRPLPRDEGGEKFSELVFWLISLCDSLSLSLLFHLCKRNNKESWQYRFIKEVFLLVVVVVWWHERNFSSGGSMVA